MLQRAAAKAGRTLAYRVIVSNFDAALRVVAANLGISVIPLEVAATYAAPLGIRIVPLTDAWSKRSFCVCFRNYAALQPAAQHMVGHLVRQAGQALRREP